MLKSLYHPCTAGKQSSYGMLDNTIGAIRICLYYELHSDAALLVAYNFKNLPRTKRDVVGIEKVYSVDCYAFSL